MWIVSGDGENDRKLFEPKTDVEGLILMQPHVLQKLRTIYIFLSIAAAIQVIPGVWDGVIHLTQPPDAFFTPLHMIIYSGAAFGIVTAVAGFFFLLDNYEYRNDNEMWGIKLALVGTVLWLFGGSFDYWWHQTLTQESFLIFHFVTPSHVVIEFAIGFFIAAGFIGYSWSTNNLVCRKLAPCFGRSWKFFNDSKLTSNCISSAESRALALQEREVYHHAASKKSLPATKNTIEENRVTLRRRNRNSMRSTLLALTFALILLSPVFTNTAFGVDITVGANPAGVAVNPNTNTIYVANLGANTISVIDGSTNTVVDTIPVGANSNGVAVNPNTNTIYVANQGANTISVIDGSTNTVVDTISVGTSPFQVSVNPNTNTVYSPNLFSNDVSIIDGSTNTVVATISVGIGPGAVVVNPNTNMIYVPNIFSDDVSVIDGSTNTVVATISVGGGPDAGVVDPTTNRLYILGLFSNTVSIIDISPASPTENTVINTLIVGDSHFGASVSFNPNTNRIFVANHNSDTLSVIDILGEIVLGAVPVGSSPAGVAVNPNTNIVYVTNQNSNTVSVIDFSANIAPVANAGPDQSVNEGVQVTLDGTSSSDINGNTLTFSWTQTGGPLVTLSDPNIANPTFMAPFVTSTTMLTFQLIVNDGTVDSAPDSVNIVVSDVSTFLVQLVEQPTGVLTGGVDVGNVAAGTSITLEFETPPGALPFAELRQKTIPIGVSGNDVSFDFIVDSEVPSNLPLPPLETDIFFDVSFTGIDFSNPSSFIQNQNPISRYFVDSSIPTDQRFPDGCPVEYIALLNEDTGQWELLGDPLQPNTNKLYVADQDSNTILVIDGMTNTLTATIPVGANPNGIDFNPNTNKIYVANQGSDTVTVIDGFTNSVVNTITGVGGHPFNIDINPNTNMVYVTNFGTNVVAVIDGSTDNVVGIIPVGVGPAGVVVNPNTNKIYIANFFLMTVSVIDGSTNSVVATIPVTDNPSLVEVNPNNNKIYITNFLSNTVTVIDGLTDTVVNTITVGAAPVGVVVNPNTNKIYVANQGSDSVSVIDGLADTVVNTITVAPGVSTIDLNENTNRVFVGQSTSGTIFVIDGFTNTVKTSVNLGASNFGEFAVNSAIPNPTRDSFADVIDQSTGEILQCGYLAQLPHLSKFSGGRPIRATETGGSDGGLFRGRTFAFGDPDRTGYDGSPPAIGEVLIQEGSIKILAKITDTVGVKDANVIIGKKAFPMYRYDGSQSWWYRVFTSADLPASGGTLLVKIVARDYNNNVAEHSVSLEVPVGALSAGSTAGSSFVITPLPSVGYQVDHSYSITANGVRPDGQNISPQITIKNTGTEPLQNIRLVLSPELKGKFLLSDYAIKNIAPNSEYTVSLKLNGKPNVDAMKNSIPYQGKLIISVDNRSPYILELSGGVPNESATLQSIFMNTLASKSEQRYKSFEKPSPRISEAEYEVRLGSGEDAIKNASDELIITNISDKPLKNLRIMTSSVSDHFMLDQKNIDILPAGSFVKIKLVSKLNAESYGELHGEIIIAPENGMPLTVPINIGRQLAEDKNSMYEIRTISGDDSISHTSDGIVIRNNSEESIDNVRIILPEQLTRVLSLSDYSFKTIEPNSERIVHIQQRGPSDSNVKQILNDYRGDITIVSSDGMKKILPVDIVWKGVSSEHFVVNARDNAEELTKAAQIINFLERSYFETAKIIGDTNTKTVIYMTSSLDEMKMLSDALAPSTYVYDEDIAFIWSNSENVNMLALKEFAYRTVMQNYGTYWAKQKISMDNGNWLVDGIANYATASIVGERGMIKEQLDAFIAEPTSVEWYGLSTPSQHGASYTLFKFLAEKYGDIIIDKTLNNLGSTMVSNHRCETVEQCALLQAVYDATGWNMNDKKHDLSFVTIVEEWKDYVEEEYASKT